MTYAFTANEKQIANLVTSFDEQYFTAPPQHATYCIRFDDCVITIYASGKVVFQGATADLYAATFFPEEAKQQKKEKEMKEEKQQEARRLQLPQAGSDEVGTGDYFGPICVCACYIDQNTYERIAGYRLIDSKQLTDEYIRQIAPDLMKKVPHSLLVLDNEKYNKVVNTNNLNMIKARMHNQAYINLTRKHITLPDNIIIDDFCGEALYYNYLKNEKSVVRNITFETKAENKFISVAVAAIIARYGFLYSMDLMSKHYEMNFPKGASSLVDEAAIAFIEKHSMEELQKVAKLNFKNTSRITENRQD